MIINYVSFLGNNHFYWYGGQLGYSGGDGVVLKIDEGIMECKVE